MSEFPAGWKMRHRRTVSSKSSETRPASTCCLVSGTCSTTSTTPNRHSGRRSRERRSVAVRRVGSARDTRNSLGKRFGRWPTNLPSTGSRHPSGSRQMSCVCHASRAFSPSRYRTTAISRLPPLWLASRSSAGVCVGSGGARCIRATRAPSVVAKSWSRLRRSPTCWPSARSSRYLAPDRTGAPALDTAAAAAGLGHAQAECRNPELGPRIGRPRRPAFATTPTRFAHRGVRERRDFRPSA